MISEQDKSMNTCPDSRVTDQVRIVLEVSEVAEDGSLRLILTQVFVRLLEGDDRQEQRTDVCNRWRHMVDGVRASSNTCRVHTLFGTSNSMTFHDQKK